MHRVPENAARGALVPWASRVEQGSRYLRDYECASMTIAEVIHVIDLPNPASDHPSYTEKKAGRTCREWTPNRTRRSAISDRLFVVPRLRLRMQDEDRDLRT